jgi:hypothetical protein
MFTIEQSIYYDDETTLLSCMIKDNNLMKKKQAYTIKYSLLDTLINREVDILEAELLELHTSTIWFDQVKRDKHTYGYTNDKAYLIHSDEVIKPFKEYNITYYQYTSILGKDIYVIDSIVAH